MVTLLGLGAALSYGIADFLGGAAARRATATRVLLLAAPIGLLLLLAGAIANGGRPTRDGLGLGFAAGLAGGIGIIMFYRALARGPMSIVAPVSALAAAVLPVAAGTVGGERLSGAVLAGVGLCVAAIALVSMERDTAGREAPAGDPGMAGRRWAVEHGPVMAAASGIAFGLFFIVLREADDGGGLWPLVAARLGTLAVILVIALVAIRAGGPMWPGRAALVPAVFSGLLDASANLLFFLAAGRGLLSLAAVLTSLYPAVTVLLARIVYTERLRMIQRAGLAIAVAGVALVTLG